MCQSPSFLRFFVSSLLCIWKEECSNGGDRNELPLKTKYKEVGIVLGNVLSARTQGEGNIALFKTAEKNPTSSEKSSLLKLLFPSYQIAQVRCSQQQAAFGESHDLSPVKNAPNSSSPRMRVCAYKEQVQNFIYQGKIQTTQKSKDWGEKCSFDKNVSNTSEKSHILMNVFSCFQERWYTAGENIIFLLENQILGRIHRATGKT